MNSSLVFRQILRYTLIIAAVILVVGGIAGYLVAGLPGVISAVIGVTMTVALSAITLASISLASKGSVNLFFATVLGAWLLKAVLFVGLLVLLRDQPFVDRTVMVVAIIAAVIGTLVVDVVVVMRSRLPYTDSPTASSTDPMVR